MFDFSPPKYEHEVRRSSLGPTVLPDHLRTKRRTSGKHVSFHAVMMNVTGDKRAELS